MAGQLCSAPMLGLSFNPHPPSSPALNLSNGMHTHHCPLQQPLCAGPRGWALGAGHGVGQRVVRGFKPLSPQGPARSGWSEVRQEHGPSASQSTPRVSGISSPFRLNTQGECLPERAGPQPVPALGPLTWARAVLCCPGASSTLGSPWLLLEESLPSPTSPETWLETLMLLSRGDRDLGFAQKLILK